MARMEGSPTSYLENLEDPTLWGLFKEAATLIRKYSTLLLPFALIFALPVSLFSAFSLESEATTLLHASSMPAAATKQVAPTASNPAEPSLNPPLTASAVIRVLTFALAIPLTKTLLTWLQVASISYCVDFIYKGAAENPPKTKPVREIFKRLPGAVYRMFITLLEFFCILLPVMSLVCLVLGVVVAVRSTSDQIGSLTLLSYIISKGFTLVFSFVFMFSDTLSILELGCYGRPALKRSMVLITQKKLRTVTVFSFQMLISLTLLALAGFVPKLGFLQGMYWIRPLGYICLALLKLVENVYSIVLVTVFYFCLKHHGNPPTTNNNHFPKLVNPPHYAALDLNESNKV
jgi:flagellar biosynthesis protein FliQ